MIQANVDKDQVKAAIKAQEDLRINDVSILNCMNENDSIFWLDDNIFLSCFQQALLAEGRFYSDLELTEKEIERMVMEVSRAEYLADSSTFKPQLGDRESSTSNAQPSSSGASESHCHSSWSISL